MGVRNWLGNKLFNIDKVVDLKVKEQLSLYGNKELDTLMRFREEENRIWALSSADRLLRFYKTNKKGTQFDTETLRFWNWVGGVNVPKLHYPLASSILNSIQSLVFGTLPTIEFETEEDSKRTQYQVLNDRLVKIFYDNNITDLLQLGAMLESYSGTLGIKYVIDKEISNTPIMQLYPQERLELTTKYNRVVEIVFLDYYKKKEKEYTLRSIYGIGYIDYVLVDDKNNKVPLSTIDELSTLERVEFNKKILMATYKKNRTTSMEFPDSAYGGSDFEGLIDIFHQTDEIYSTMNLYIRRSRPIMPIVESLLPTTEDGRRTIIPKEFEYDIIKLRKDQDASQVNKLIDRDIPEIKLEQYLNGINELKKAAYQRIGYSLPSVDLEGVGANQSGTALQELEKATLILYKNKVNGWKHALDDIVRKLLIYEDIMNTKTINDEYNDYDLTITFADYHDDTLADRIKTFSEAYKNDIVDIETMVYETLGKEYEDEKLDKIVRNIKIEKGIPLLQEQFESDIE